MCDALMKIDRNASDIWLVTASGRKVAVNTSISLGRIYVLACSMQVDFIQIGGIYCLGCFLIALNKLLDKESEDDVEYITLVDLQMNSQEFVLDQPGYGSASGFSVSYVLNNHNGVVKSIISNLNFRNPNEFRIVGALSPLNAIINDMFVLSANMRYWHLQVREPRRNSDIRCCAHALGSAQRFNDAVKRLSIHEVLPDLQ